MHLTTAFTFILMIGAAGSTRHPGRIIDGNYERGLTIQLAEQLKTALEKTYQGVSVILQRTSDGRQFDQHATIANRMAIDLYLALMLYEQQEASPHIALYTYATHPRDRLQNRDNHTLQFIPYDQAHTLTARTSKQWAQHMRECIQRTPLFVVPGNTVHALPLLPLKGICVPQIGIELSIQSSKDIAQYVPILVEALGSIIAPGIIT